MTRTFEDKIAVREQTPVFVGLVGPSGGGKTYSALRIASGIQSVTGGDIYGIDTEADRMKAYADNFKFRHVPFGAPFSPLDYLAAIDHCVAKGAKTIVIDSMSHEHEGPGGLLEMHEREMGGNFKKQMIAWAKPKAARRRLINAILQVKANFIFCFRAKEKMKIVQGKDPVPLGFMAIGGEEWIYEMTVATLLLPNANGVPLWQSDQPGERLTIKLPEQFRSVFASGEQLGESHGAAMAKWAAGGVARSPVDDLVSRYSKCDEIGFSTLESERKILWSTIKGKTDEQSRLKAAAQDAQDRLKEEREYLESHGANEGELEKAAG